MQSPIANEKFAPGLPDIFLDMRNQHGTLLTANQAKGLKQPIFKEAGCAMNEWIKKMGYDTCLQASGATLGCEGAEVHLIRFREGKFNHYHKDTTEFFHITAGSGKVLLDGRVMQLSPGTSFIVRPHVRHLFINDSHEQLLEAVLVKTNTHADDTHPV